MTPAWAAGSHAQVLVVIAWVLIFGYILAVAGLLIWGIWGDLNSHE